MNLTSLGTSKAPLVRFLYHVRNLRSKALFDVLQKYCKGQVLDIGGWDFYLTVRTKKISYDRWVILESDRKKMWELEDSKCQFIIGDGCHSSFENDTFDTVVSIQVLEHVFEPIRMFEEMVRLLKPGGFGVVMVPQTSNLHLAPEHFQNFTIYWLRQACRSNKVNIVEEKPLGGFWSTIASRMFYFFLHSTRRSGFSDPHVERNMFFYLLFPLMSVWAMINVVVCLFLSLGDLAEEPNNHLIVFQKPSGATP